MILIGYLIREGGNPYGERISASRTQWPVLPERDEPAIIDSMIPQHMRLIKLREEGN